MSSTKLRLLAECLERNFMTAEDRKGWVSDLRGMAKDVERSVMVEQPPPTEQPLPTPADLGHLRDYMIRAKFWLEHGARAATQRSSQAKLELEAAELRRGIKYIEKFLPAKMK